MHFEGPPWGKIFLFYRARNRGQQHLGEERYAASPRLFKTTVKQDETVFVGRAIE
jgi:hypothetical protein